MLIGGDGKVTLIDFQASRSIIPIPDVQLEQAWPEELSREMRKVLVKLDYPGARMAEQRRQNAEAPLDDQDSVPLDEWNQNWIFPDLAPKRFVMPGQTPEQLQAAVHTFLALIDKLQKSELCDPPPSSPSSPFHPTSDAVRCRKRKGDDVIDPRTQDKRQRCFEDPDRSQSGSSDESTSSGSQTVAPSAHEPDREAMIIEGLEILRDTCVHSDRVPPTIRIKRKAEAAFPQSYSKTYKFSRTNKHLGSLRATSLGPEEDKSDIQASKSLSVDVGRDDSTPPMLLRSTLSLIALPCTVMSWTRNMLSRLL